MMNDHPVCRALAKHAHWLPRLALAAVFLTAGIPKFQHLADYATMSGFPLWVMFLVALGEVGGSALLLIGPFTKSWVTRLGAFGYVPVMLGAIFLVHWGQWSAMPTESHPFGGVQFQTVLLAMALYFVLVGNGRGACLGCKCKK